MAAHAAGGPALGRELGVLADLDRAHPGPGQRAVAAGHGDHHRTRRAAGVRQALTKVATQRFDAIFLDVRMPDLDGLELGRVLRRFASPPQLVFVSAYDSAAVEAFELHALDYLRKPVARRRLEEAIERVAAAIDAERRRLRGTAVSGGPTGPATTRWSPWPTSTGLDPAAAARLDPVRPVHGDFVRIVTADGRYLLRATLAESSGDGSRSASSACTASTSPTCAAQPSCAPLIGGTAELDVRRRPAIPVARRHTAELGRRLSV